MTLNLFGHFVLFENKSFIADVKYVPNSKEFFPSGFPLFPTSMLMIVVLNW